MTTKKSKLDMLFTVHNNIKCLDTNKDNKFRIRDNKIYFENNHIDKKINITMISMFKGTFKFTTDDDTLAFGIDNLSNQINDSGYMFVKSKVINDKIIKFYKINLEIEVNSVVADTKFYVLDSSDNIYEIPLIYNESCKLENCALKKYQSYALNDFGKVVISYTLNNLTKDLICSKSNVYRIKKLNYQQNLYTSMRLYPHRFPIISKVKNLNLTYAQKRAYSNMWWRQFGTSQALPVNDNFGGFYLVGSEVPYTN